MAKLQTSVILCVLRERFYATIYGGHMYSVLFVVSPLDFVLA